jgi:hypothetical protein
MQRIACLFAAILACASALAKDIDYNGTYTAKNASGGTMTLTLAHEAANRVSGTLTGHGTSSLHVQARVEGEGLRGTAGNTFGMLYMTGRLKGEELILVLAESDLGGKPNPQRSTELRLAKAQGKTGPQNNELRQALTRNAWCSVAYTIHGKRTTERLVFNSNGLVTQTPGPQARWRVQNETLEFSRDGLSWSPEPIRLALSSTGSPVLQTHDKEYAQCD